MKLCLIKADQMHHKNLNSLKKYNAILCNESTDIIYSPCYPIEVNQQKNTKFIFGPHFSTFPRDDQMHMIKGATYIQPSEWVKKLWESFNICQGINIKVLPWGVDTEKFTHIKPLEQRDKVFIYYKRRNPAELTYLMNFLHEKKIVFKVFDYIKRYDEDEYLKYLQDSTYGIILDAHESQGFAIEEAMSCNVPLLVWNVTRMDQEYGSNYKPYPATSIPYWDSRCGEVFYTANDLCQTYDIFINKLPTYNPRQYIIEHLSIPVCEKKFMDLINEI